MIVVYSPRYHIDIGLHVFPTDKYRRVRDRIVETGVVQASDIVEPRLASWDELALVHTTEYLEKLRTGGSGGWGSVPMPANPGLARDDARALVQWILGGAR